MPSLAAIRKTTRKHAARVQGKLTAAEDKQARIDARVERVVRELRVELITANKKGGAREDAVVSVKDQYGDYHKMHPSDKAALVSFVRLNMRQKATIKRQRERAAVQADARMVREGQKQEEREERMRVKELEKKEKSRQRALEKRLRAEQRKVERSVKKTADAKARKYTNKVLKKLRARSRKSLKASRRATRAASRKRLQRLKRLSDKLRKTSRR